jgi:pimeloyl-ACP methyl ester carboxylesterase
MTETARLSSRKNTHGDYLPDLAYVHEKGMSSCPPVLFLGGLRSDMNGTKALFLEDTCRRRGHSFTRFDYRGHGLSDGVFQDSTISDWYQDALAILDHVYPKQPVILIGSSLGGWISLLIAKDHPQRVSGLIGIAAAPDFTDSLWEEELSPAQRDDVLTHGFVAIPNPYDPNPYIFTKALIEDGRQNRILDRDLSWAGPVYLLQGKQDDSVAWETAEKIEKRLCNAHVKTVLIEDGDHRLSRAEDLLLLEEALKTISACI